MRVHQCSYICAMFLKFGFGKKTSITINEISLVYSMSNVNVHYQILLPHVILYLLVMGNRGASFNRYEDALDSANNQPLYGSKNIEAPHVKDNCQYKRQYVIQI